LIGPGRPFGGLHPGGLNVLFVDGAASYFTESIDPDVFAAMARIHGG
jgi:prepilin-type processing-associated H-X9-DG protein